MNYHSLQPLCTVQFPPFVWISILIIDVTTSPNALIDWRHKCEICLDAAAYRNPPCTQIPTCKRCVRHLLFKRTIVWILWPLNCVGMFRYGNASLSVCDVSRNEVTPTDQTLRHTISGSSLRPERWWVVSAVGVSINAALVSWLIGRLHFLHKSGVGMGVWVVLRNYWLNVFS